MARIVGAIGTSHVPAIGRAIARNEQAEPGWRDFFESYEPARRWVADAQPEVAVVFYNDHGLNFFLDKMPTFAVGAADRYVSADEGWGLPVQPAIPGDMALSWEVIEGLVAAEFDVTTCQEMLVDHAIQIPLQLLWPPERGDLRILPIALNTVQHPLPSARRCFALGKAVGAAIRQSRSDARVVVIGSGGLSHQLDGERAGFLNPAFDHDCLSDLIDQPERLLDYSTHQLVELAGTQGVELLSWIAMRGAVEHPQRLHQAYHAPISNTGAAVLVMCEDGAQGRVAA